MPINKVVISEQELLALANCVGQTIRTADWNSNTQSLGLVLDAPEGTIIEQPQPNRTDVAEVDAEVEVDGPSNSDSVA